MHDKGLAGSGGTSVRVEFNDRLRKPPAGATGAIPIFLILLLSITLLNPPIVGCNASPLVMRGSGPQRVKLIPIYYAGNDNFYPAGSGQAQLILGGRRFFHSADQLRTHPLQPPLFIPVVQNTGPADGSIDEKKKKRGPQNMESPTALTTSGIGEEGLSVAGVADQRLLRIERNPSPSSRELYQINTVGDMPVLRFGRRR